MAVAFVTGQGNHIALMNQLGSKNMLINAGFTVNQRVYVSAAVLAAGNYGHDRWKAGASGGDYTFTQLESPTQITIASGKSLIQVIENKNVHGTQLVLSWEGTAQARYGVNTATPSGSYAASPIVITGQTVGTVMSVEFNAGTLGKVMLEVAVADPSNFEFRPWAIEYRLCRRYYRKSFPYATAPAQNSGTTVGAQGYIVVVGGGTNYYSIPIAFDEPMRASPTVTFYNPNAANAKMRNTNLPADSSTSAVTANLGSDHGFMLQNQQVAGDLASHTLAVHYDAVAEL